MPCQDLSRSVYPSASASLAESSTLLAPTHTDSGSAPGSAPANPPRAWGAVRSLDGLLRRAIVRKSRDYSVGKIVYHSDTMVKPIPAGGPDTVFGARVAERHEADRPAAHVGRAWHQPVPLVPSAPGHRRRCPGHPRGSLMAGT